MGATALPEAIAAEDEVDVTLEPQPVADSEVWIANCELWRSELQARIGGPFELRWFDPDGLGPMTSRVLIYESAP